MGVHEDSSDSPMKGDQYGDEEPVAVDVDSAPVVDWTEEEERKVKLK